MQSHLDVPYILYGHSMGALIAFELARAFRRMGMPTPKALVVSGRRAPQVSKAEAVPHDLDDDQFWMRIGALYGTTHELLENAELKAMLLPSFRADFELLNLWNYEDETRFGFPIFAMGGESDPGISEADIKAWQRETTAHFDSRMFSGGHMFIQPREIEFVGALREIFDAL